MSKHQLQLATKVCALFSSEFSSINARLVSCYFSQIFILFQPLVLRLRFVIRHLYTWGMNESWNKPTDVNEKKPRKCQQSSMENFAVFFFFGLKNIEMLLGWGNGVLLCTFELCHDQMPMFPLFQWSPRVEKGGSSLNRWSGHRRCILTRPLPDSLLTTLCFLGGYQGAEQRKNLFKRILQSCICDLLHDTHERLGLFV